MRKKAKKQIMSALSDDKRGVIHIEISKSQYVADKWNIRIGDILGSTEFSNVEIKTILEQIESEMLDL